MGTKATFRKILGSLSQKLISQKSREGGVNGEGSKEIEQKRQGREETMYAGAGVWGRG